MSQSISQKFTPISLLKFALPSIHGYDDVYVVLYDCGWNFYFKISWQ